MMDQHPPLAVRALTAAYRGTPALWDVSFTVPPGQLVGIVGPNGAGKSTLLKVAMGLLRPVAGAVEVFGRPTGSTRGLVGYLPVAALPPGRHDLRMTWNADGPAEGPLERRDFRIPFWTTPALNRDAVSNGSDGPP